MRKPYTPPLLRANSYQEAPSPAPHPLPTGYQQWRRMYLSVDRESLLTLPPIYPQTPVECIALVRKEYSDLHPTRRHVDPSCAYYSYSIDNPLVAVWSKRTNIYVVYTSVRACVRVPEILTKKFTRQQSTHILIVVLETYPKPITALSLAVVVVFISLQITPIIALVSTTIKVCRIDNPILFLVGKSDFH